MTPITMVVPYYGPPKGLARAFEEITRYSRDQVETIVVDDGCADPVADYAPTGAVVLRMPGPKVPWNLPACCNRAAEVASHEWLLLTAADHILLVRELPAVLEFVKYLALYPGQLYGIFARRSWDGEILPGTGILLVHRDTYLAIGGYDEQYCGAYGLGGNDLRRRLPGRAVVVPEVELVWWIGGEEHTLDRDRTANRVKFDAGPRQLPPLNRKGAPCSTTSKSVC